MLDGVAERDDLLTASAAGEASVARTAGAAGEIGVARGTTSESRRAAVVGVDLQWAGRQLRALREARGVSQSELARRTGSPRTYLIALEQGKHEPALDLLGRIAGALDYPLRDLLWYLAGEPFADPAAPLAARVRLRRERLGLRPVELAARAGTTRATISQVERGTNANPGLALLARLAAALHCCPSELAPPGAGGGDATGGARAAASPRSS